MSQESESQAGNGTIRVSQPWLEGVKQELDDVWKTVAKLQEAVRFALVEVQQERHGE